MSGLSEARVGPKSSRRALRAGVVIGLSLSLVPSGTARAQLELEGLTRSPDVTLELAGIPVTPVQAVIDGSPPLPVPLGALPREANLTAYHVTPSGDRLFALDRAADLEGLHAEPGDVVRYDGNTYSLELEARPRGVPAGVRVDAIGQDPFGRLLLSFDVSVSLPGAGATIRVDDEDVVRVSLSSFSVLLDGSRAGLNPRLDIDALHRLAANGNLLLSFDTSGSVGGVRFADEDVLEYDPRSASWSLAARGIDAGAAWRDANLDALYADGDADGDGILDHTDNCAGLANVDQTDTGGVGAAVADGIGDECQCGDLSGGGQVEQADVSLYRLHLSDPNGTPLSASALARCSVRGTPVDCDVLDVAVIRRSLGALQPGIAQVCAAAVRSGSP